MFFDIKDIRILSLFEENYAIKNDDYYIIHIC